MKLEQLLFFFLMALSHSQLAIDFYQERYINMFGCIVGRYTQSKPTHDGPKSKVKHVRETSISSAKLKPLYQVKEQFMHSQVKLKAKDKVCLASTSQARKV